MSKRPQLLLLWLSLLSLAGIFQISLADIGTASHYSPQYLPTACFGRVGYQFPPNNLFAAAGDGIWDNGEACGREYKVTCISAAVPRSCIQGQVIQVRIVDRAETAVSNPIKPGATIVLSNRAFSSIANLAIGSINIEYLQV